MSTEEKLKEAERKNEVYREQLGNMQQHLEDLRSLIQDKEKIIENLMLRFDLGIIGTDTSKTSAITISSEIDKEEFVRKVEALGQRTILENFELREMVNELRDENFHLRNEIYELQDKLNRQALQMNDYSRAVDTLEDMILSDVDDRSSEKISKKQRMTELDRIRDEIQLWRSFDEDGYRKGSDPDNPADVTHGRRPSRRRRQSSIEMPDLFDTDSSSSSSSEEDSLD